MSQKKVHLKYLEEILHHKFIKYVMDNSSQWGFICVQCVVFDKNYQNSSCA